MAILLELALLVVEVVTSEILLIMATIAYYPVENSSFDFVSVKLKNHNFAFPKAGVNFLYLVQAEVQENLQEAEEKREFQSFISD